MSEFNKQEMTEIADEIIDILKFCLANKNIWKSDKQRMLTMIKDHNETFYERYPRICRIMVNSDDITPLLTMIKTFGEVQAGKMSLDKANNMMSGQINNKYVDPVLQSDKLVKEREEKQKVVELDS